MRILVPMVLLFSGLIGGALPSFAQGPKLVVGNPVFDFGEISQGESLEHLFKISNAGDGDLIISRVRTSCGCTAALLSASRIPPNETGEVRTTFNSGRFLGPVEKIIYLYSNDPLRVTHTLRLRGTVLPELELVPAQIALNEGASGRQERRIDLINHGRQPLIIHSVQGTDPALRATITAGTISPGERAQIVLQVEVSGSRAG